MMRPVYEPALSVPNVLTLESDPISDLEVFDARGEFDIVLYENGLTGRETKNESLMRTAGRVVCKYPRHDALVFNRDVAFTLLERTRDG